MSKLAFYIILSLLTVSSLFLVQNAVDHAEGNLFFRDMLPKPVRLFFLNANLPERSSEMVNHTFIIGTSHVQYGFNECANTSISQIFEPGMSGEMSVSRANAIMSAADLSNIDRVNIILEMTLIERIAPQPQKNITTPAKVVLESRPVFYNLIQSSFGQNKINCDAQHYRDYDVNQLAISLAESAKLNDLDIENLFLRYTDHLNQLIEVCDATNNARITLVTLPVHPDLYSTANVKSAFQALEANISHYLNKVKNESSCDISYLNLITLGTDFPEQKFWVDPGHFRSVVGERVLAEVELFYASKQL